VCRDSARSAEVEKPFKVSEKESSGGRVPLCTEQQLQGVQEVGENLSRFHKSRKPRREISLRTQTGAKDTYFTEETKAETFGTWKIFQGK
jgi:hypothetical protein